VTIARLATDASAARMITQFNYAIGVQIAHRKLRSRRMSSSVRYCRSGNAVPPSHVVSCRAWHIDTDCGRNCAQENRMDCRRQKATATRPCRKSKPPSKGLPPGCDQPRSPLHGQISRARCRASKIACLGTEPSGVDRSLFLGGIFQ